MWAVTEMEPLFWLPLSPRDLVIEGFFATCRTKGLTEGQGVMIPTANVANLMLRNDVVQAVRDGGFHIYAVNTIEEGISILTGMEAGTPDKEGRYSEGSLFHLVEKKLDSYAEAFRKYCLPPMRRND